MFLGLDLCFGRWDNHLHRLTDFGSAVRPPTLNKTVTSPCFHLLIRLQTTEGVSRVVLFLLIGGTDQKNWRSVCRRNAGGI